MSNSDDKIQQILANAKANEIDKRISNRYEKNAKGILLPTSGVDENGDTIEQEIFEKLGRPFVVHRYIRQDDNSKINFMLTTYISAAPPYGCLPRLVAAHALFTYALNTTYLYISNKEKRLQLEGEEDLTFDYFNIFKSTANQYGVEPEEMAKYWQPVRREFLKLFSTKIPKPVQKAGRKVFNFDQEKQTRALYKGEGK